MTWTNIQTIVDSLTATGLKIIPLIAIIAFLIFVLGVGRYIRSTGSEADLKKTKNILIWGVVGLFVLFSIWGILAFLQGEFFDSTDVGIPQIRFGNSEQVDSKMITDF
jgi:hypothetical protein